MNDPRLTPEYWEQLAHSERVFAAQKRSSRFGSADSIRVHLASAEEYEAWAAKLRAQQAESTNAKEAS